MRIMGYIAILLYIDSMVSLSTMPREVAILLSAAFALCIAQDVKELSR